MSSSMNSRERGTFCVRNSSVKLLPVLPNDKILRSLDESRSRVGQFSSCERMDLLSFFFLEIDLVDLKLTRFARPRSLLLLAKARLIFSFFYSSFFYSFLRARAQSSKARIRIMSTTRRLLPSFPLVIQRRVRKKRERWI